MKILFIGCVKFSEKILTFLIQNKYQLIGVCTKNESKFNSDFVDLSKICNKNNIDYLFCKNINQTENVDWIKSKKPDLILCLGWSQILSENILQIPRYGVIGFHPAELPLNRGRHPIIWSLVLGLESTASTFFFMDKQADEGDIISQEKIKINKSDNAEKLYEKITKKALMQIKTFLPLLKTKKLKTTSQKNQKSNTWRKRSYKDGLIDWRMSANSINNLVRGLTKPYPGAVFISNSKEYKVWKSKVVKEKMNNIEPGKIIKISNNGQLTVKCGEQSLRIIEYEPRNEFQINEYI